VPDSPSESYRSPQTIGAYRLLEQVARGGSSAVWRACAPDGRVVALKVLDAAQSASPAERQRFLRGFKIASTLVHAGIARLVEAGEHDGRLFVVEEFVEGETLSERLHAGRMSIDEAVRILRECAHALAYAHEAGVVHRDLSPRNLMLDRAGRVVLIDFGIAVKPEGTTIPATNSLIGTFHYLAPELIRGRPATARSDLYALGAIGYHMLTGSPPFAASQPEAVLQHHLQTKPECVRTLRPDVPVKIDRVILRLLAKTPEERFHTADEFASTLEAASTPPRRPPTAATSGARRRGAHALRRLAVLPFTADLDDTADADRERRVALGMAETVAAGLAGLEDLTVIPPAQAPLATRVPSELAKFLAADAILSGHLTQREATRRLAWTLVGPDGSVIDGGRVTGSSDALFDLEDELLGEVMRALRRPTGATRVRAVVARDGWYEAFVEALGCLQRADDAEQVDRAITLLEQARDGGAGGVQVHAALGRAYLRRAEITSDATWRDRAETSCRIAIALDPLAPEAILTMGRVMVANGRARESTTILDRALHLDPTNVEIKLWLSRAHEMAGGLEEATRYACEACQDHPEQWAVHDRKAVLDYRGLRFEEAAQHWQKVIELTPDNARAHAKLGATRFQLGDLDGAEKSYRAALDVQRFPEAITGLGSMLFFQGRMREAIECCREAVVLSPGSWRLWGNLADAQRWVEGERASSLDSFDRAIGLLRAELAVNPLDSKLWAYLALYLAKREQHTEARSALARAFETGTASGQVVGCAVVVHELAGRRAEAISALEILRARPPLPYEVLVDPELRDLLNAVDAESEPKSASSPSTPARFASGT
jgi:serine/threonine-protein kinase